MKNMTAENMAKAAGGNLTGPQAMRQKEITEVVTDSRKIVSGCLFAAIRGNRSDGHAYIGQAIRDGAGVILAERLPEGTEASIPVILVEDTLRALRALAAYYLDQMTVSTVGIIGSAGKTSTKEMVASVLQQKYRVLKTEGNFNNELGVPLTVFRIREEHEIAVIEMGINHFGEMCRLAQIVRPDTVVMTNIGTAHLEFLKSRDGILKAKSEVFEFLRPDGAVILNGDDDKLITLQQVNGVRPVFFGVHNTEADVYADHIQLQDLTRVYCDVRYRREDVPGEYGRFRLAIPSPGIHAVQNALAAAAAGLRYGLSEEEIMRGVDAYQGLRGRFHVLQTGSLTVIDDSYNANPSSMKGSLEILQNGSERRVAILGDMGELGEDTESLHREVGVYAAGLQIDALYMVGTLCRHMAEGAKAACEQTAAKFREETGTDVGPARIPEIVWFPDRDSLMEKLADYIRPGDTILIKASRFMGFEKIADALQKMGI